MSTVEQIAAITSPSVTPGFPDIFHIERISVASRKVLDAIWNAKYGGEVVGVYRLTDVFAAGIGLIFDDRGNLMTEFLVDQSASDIERGTKEVQRQIASGAVETVTGDCMVLNKPGYHNYGHWLVELLPQLLIARDYVEGFNPLIFVAGVGQAIDAVRYDSIRDRFSTNAKIVAYDWIPRLFKSLYVVRGHSLHGPFQAPIIYQALKRGITPETGSRRLYIRRAAAHISRAIVNETEIMPILERHGFEAIMPETLTFSEQRQLFAESEITIGAAGAGLSNVCWQSPGTSCICLYPESMQDTFFWWASRHNQVCYHDVRCQIIAREGLPSWNGDIEVDPKELEWLLSKHC